MALNCELFATAEDMLFAQAYEAGGVLVCEFRLLGMNGIELQQRLADLGSSMQIVFHTAHAETWLTVLAMRNGAVTVLDKTASERELCDSIRFAMNQYVQVSEQESIALQTKRNIQQLSQREREVLRFMIEGLANKQIARRLEISIRTVEGCRHRIFEKTGTRSLAQLVRFVVQSKVDLAAP